MSVLPQVGCEDGYAIVAQHAVMGRERVVEAVSRAATSDGLTRDLHCGWVRMRMRWWEVRGMHSVCLRLQKQPQLIRND